MTASEMPDWLVNDSHYPEPEPSDRVLSGGPPRHDVPAAYAQAALEQECAEVARTGQGGRNHRLNAAAFSLGQLVGAHLLGEQAAAAALQEAAASCGLVSDDGVATVTKTIASGLKAGIAQPRQVSEREVDEIGRASAAALVRQPARGTLGRIADLVEDDTRRHRALIEWDMAERAKGARDPAPSLIRATPYTWTDPASIPMRDWLYGHHLIRCFVSATVAPGGVGKTGLKVAEALAMVVGRDILGDGSSRQPLRVWLWNLEDPRDELTRCVQAAAKHYGLTPEDLGDRLFLDTGREQELVIAEATRAGAVIQRPMVEALVGQLREREIDVLIVDPFVSCHRVSENDNTAIDMVAKEWGRVADRGRCAIDLVHHTRKGSNLEEEITVESARGAKALTDACRSVITLNRMSEDEARKAGVEQPRAYFRTYADKSSLAPPADRSDWCHLVSVNLGNGPLGFGDSVRVVERWQWPNAFQDVTPADLAAVQAKVAESEWRADVQASAWVGKAVAEVLGLDASEPSAKAKIKAIVETWIKNGALREVERKDAARRPKTYVVVGE